jgi:plastocyanin
MNRGLFSILLAFVLLGCKSEPVPQRPQSRAHDELVTVDPATSGSISGTVSFRGPARPWPALDMSADPACPTGPLIPDVVVVDRGRLANVFIYIKDGLPPGRFAVPATPVVLDQKGCRYVPHVVGVMAGQKMEFLNSDATEHNIHPMTRNNPEWNESERPRGPSIVNTFPVPELMIPVECNQHPWMRAYINVVAHPYYAVSSKDGNYEIRNLPPGEYTLAAIQEKFGEQIVRVKVWPKESAQADFTFHPRE